MAASNRASEVEILPPDNHLDQSVEIAFKQWETCKDGAQDRPLYPLLAIFKPFTSTVGRVYTVGKLLEVAKASPDGQLLKACREVEIPEIAMSVKVIYSHASFTYSPLADSGHSQQILFPQPGFLPQHDRKEPVRIEIAIEIPLRDDPDEWAEKIEALIAKQS